MLKYKDILKAPVITEKSASLKDRENKYVFEVVSTATKGQVKNVVEALFKVVVEDVKMLNVRGKIKRSMTNRKNEYRSKDTKKAIVKLAEKDTIKLFEGEAK